LVAVVLALFPPVVHVLHKRPGSGGTTTGRVGSWWFWKATGGHTSPRWGGGDKNTSKHDDETQHADNGLSENNTRYECGDTQYSHQDSNYEDGVVRFPSSGRDCSNEVRIVVIETALHLFQEALLLFGKWHPVPLRLGIDAV
jgi:hypothetical protein